MRNRILFSAIIGCAYIVCLSACKLTRISKLSPQELYEYRNRNFKKSIYLPFIQEPSIAQKNQYSEPKSGARSSGNSDPAPLLLREHPRTTEQ